MSSVSKLSKCLSSKILPIKKSQEGGVDSNNHPRAHVWSEKKVLKIPKSDVLKHIDKIWGKWARRREFIKCNVFFYLNNKIILMVFARVRIASVFCIYHTLNASL